MVSTGPDLKSPVSALNSRGHLLQVRLAFRCTWPSGVPDLQVHLTFNCTYWYWPLMVSAVVSTGTELVRSGPIWLLRIWVQCLLVITNRYLRVTMGDSHVVVTHTIMYCYHGLSISPFISMPNVWDVFVTTSTKYKKRIFLLSVMCWMMLWFLLSLLLERLLWLLCYRCCAVCCCVCCCICCGACCELKGESNKCAITFSQQFEQPFEQQLEQQVEHQFKQQSKSQ